MKFSNTGGNWACLLWRRTVRGVWIDAIHVANIGGLLSLDVPCVSIALRVGADVCTGLICHCGRLLNSAGLHGLSCCLNAGCFVCHTELNLILKQSLAWANIPLILEPSGLSRCDGNRPDGLTLCPWSQGRCLVGDVTVNNSFASHILGAVVRARSTASVAERNKILKYSDLSANYIFHPVAFETFVGVGPLTARFLFSLATCLAEVTGEACEGPWLFQRISLAITYGNAAIAIKEVSQCPQLFNSRC
ncbi:Hypothetical predicted protein [Octopus vulgaris]|uniref:Uncharacterized protein n=1 Tax=Octopus vulgaris TaxID=6645 RepID=A0AA36EZM3_OCTVU|nr:Hypothetical predicted protein [Octopus vulgaris]